MIDLMLEGWCEPPKALAMHLLTLTHQILSVIAEKGGVLGYFCAPSAESNLLCAEAAIVASVTAARRALRSVAHSVSVRLIGTMQPPEPGGITTPNDHTSFVRVSVPKKTTILKK